MGKDLSQIEHVLMVCQGSDCKKGGAKDIQRALKAELKAQGARKAVAIVRTKCNGLCKKGPVVCFQPANKWLLNATPKKATQVLGEVLK